MRRSSILKLRAEKWVPVHESTDLELCIVPSAGTTMLGLRNGILSDQDKLNLCQSVFVNFKNYLDENDDPLPNTLEHRLELIDSQVVFYALQRHVVQTQGEIYEGEDSAVSA